MSDKKGPRERIGCPLIPEPENHRKKNLAAAYKEAARDPVFMQEVHAIDVE